MGLSIGSFYCVDVNCENFEPVEAHMNCPSCGAKSELVSYLYVQQLLDKKQKNQKFIGKLLFHPSQTVEDLINKRDEFIKDLAELESKKYPKDEDEIKILLLTGKIQIIQSELSFLAMSELTTKLMRLFGL